MSECNIILPSKKRKKDIFDEEFIRKLEYWSLAFKRLYGGELSAARRSKEVGSGIEFSDRREYMAGDDFRYVDWKALGRMDRAFVRLFVEEKDLKVNLLIDSSASMDVGDPPKIETALKLGAVLSYMVLFNLDRVALTIFSEGVEDYTPPARGKARIRKILDTLREIEPGGKTDLKKLATGVAGRDSKAGLIIIISDLMVGDGFDECISRLMYGGSEVSAIRVLAPEDEKPWLIQDHAGRWLGPFAIGDLVCLPMFSLMMKLKNLHEMVEAPAREFPQVRLALRRLARKQPVNPSQENRCPRCRVPLGERFYEGVAIKACPKCAGKLVAIGAMERLLARREVAFSEALLTKAEAFRQKFLLNPIKTKKINGAVSEKLTCPHCGYKMVPKPYSYQYFVPVDKCLSCYKIWFDADELEILQILIEHSGH